MSETLGKATGSGASLGHTITPVSAARNSLSSQLNSLGDTIATGLAGISPFISPISATNSGGIQDETASFIGRIAAATASQDWLTNSVNGNLALATTLNNAAIQNALINQSLQKAEDTTPKSETGKKVQTESDSASKATIDKNVNVEHKSGSVAAGEKAAGDSDNGSGQMSEESINGALAEKLNSNMAAELDGLDIVVGDSVKDAAGWFSSNMSIALSKDGTMATMFHEVGHALQHKLGGGLGAVRNGAEGGWGDAKMNAHMDTIRDKMVASNFQMGELNGGYGWNNQNKKGSHDQAEEYAEAFSMWATQREEFEKQFGSEIANDFDEFFGKQSQEYDSTEPIQEAYPQIQPLFMMYNPAAMRLLFGIGPQIQVSPAFQPQILPRVTF